MLDDRLVRAGERTDPGTDVDRHTTYVIAHQLALAGVQARPQLDVKGPHLVPDRASAADPARRAVEGGQKAIAHRLHLAATVALQLSAQLTPTMKLKRRPIAAKYAVEIEALYT